MKQKVIIDMPGYAAPINVSLSAAGFKKGDRILAKVAPNEWHGGIIRSSGARLSIVFDDGATATVDPEDFKDVKRAMEKLPKRKKPFTTAEMKVWTRVAPAMPDDKKKAKAKPSKGGKVTSILDSYGGDLSADVEALLRRLDGAGIDGDRIVLREIPTGTSKDVNLYVGFANSPGLYPEPGDRARKWTKVKERVLKRVRDEIASRNASFAIDIRQSRMKDNRMGVNWVRIITYFVNY